MNQQNLLYDARRQWNHFLGLMGKKHLHAARGNWERVEDYNRMLEKVDADLTATEARLKQYERVDDTPATSWHDMPWAQMLTVASKMVAK